MEKQTLHELLDGLHKDLHAAPSLNEDDRTLLLELQADIRRLLTPVAEGDTLPEPLPRQSYGRLREAALRFAGSHPRLASTLDRLANAFGNAGL